MEETKNLYLPMSLRRREVKSKTKRVVFVLRSQMQRPTGGKETKRQETLRIKRIGKRRRYLKEKVKEGDCITEIEIPKTVERCS